MNTRFVTRFRLTSATIALSAVSALAADYYVATTGDDAGDGSLATPFATLGAAISAANAAIDGGTVVSAAVHVAAGTYTGAGYVLDHAVTVVGAGACGTVIDGDGGYRVFSLLSSNAALKNLCVSNGVFSAAEQTGAGIYMEAGLVEDCAVASCGSFSPSKTSGGGIYASGGRVRRTVFTGNRVHTRWSGDVGWGSALYLSNGAICENSLFTGNAAISCFDWDAAQRRGGVVHLTDAGTALVNCTVVQNGLADASGNNNNNYAGIVQKNYAKIVNCVAYGNAPDAAFAESSGDVYIGGDEWRNNWQNYVTDSAWGTALLAKDHQPESPVAECVSRGIYLTTDLYVSRRATWRDLGIDRDGNAPMKAVQFATERGFRDWCDFARLFLTHVNPYTGRALADEPALISLCTQNECFWNMDFKATCAVPELGLARLWARFLDEERKKSPGAWAGLSPERPPARTLPWTPETEEDSALYAFWNWLHGRFYRRAERFLRRELGVRTLLTGDNFALLSGSVLAMQDAAYGYCDVHSYQNVFVDWVGRRWEQPLRAGSCNPVFRTRGMPEDTLGYGRLWGKPFFVTEWDYDGINAYRSMAGLSFGSMGALQAWTGMWRFAFDHSRRNLPDDTGVPGLFNLARDPLALAGDRATLSLYLRRDMAEATDALAVDFTDALLAAAKGRDWRPAPGWRGGDVAWTHRVGAIVRGKDAPPKARVVARDEFERLGASAFTKPDSGVRGQRVSIDRARGTFAVSTPRTCGVFAEGGRVEAGALRVRVENNAATVFAISLDGAPLGSSARILLTHLTDCRARGFATTDALGTVILRWSGDANPDGTMPLFLKEGTAEVSLALNPAEWRVWALGTDGRRECKVPCAFDPATSRLRFTASVRQPFGGCMAYEIVRQ